MSRISFRTLVVAVAVLCLHLPARAQEDQADPFKTARIRIGPLAVNPTIGIKDVGVDTNVFNEWDDPKKDFTATISPGADIWFRAGRTRLIGRASLGYQYFQQYGSERAINGDVSGRYEIDLFHVRPYVIASYLNTRERPGFEIDARARRFENAYGAGVDVPLTSRTVFGVLARRRNTSYASDAIYLGTYLREVFDRRQDTVDASFRYRATPLTTLVLLAGAERTRFLYSPGRNSDGVRIMPGVEFNAFAIIQGSAYVGYRKIDMLAGTIANFRGPVASVDLGYTLLGSTRFAVQVKRDVDYSFEADWPYYVQTGFIGTITQRVVGPFDVQARYGRQSLDYVPTNQSASGADRSDNVVFYGGGVGYRFGRSTRLGLNIDSYRRRSQISTRTYEGLRIGSSLTYGF